MLPLVARSGVLHAQWAHMSSPRKVLQPPPAPAVPLACRHRRDLAKLAIALPVKLAKRLQREALEDA